ncbi:nucleotide-binding protein, partial [Klebsiella variicola]
MTAVIALANGKGGVKKSSMSRAIATEYTKAGWGVLGLDMDIDGTVAKLAMRQPFVLFKGLTFQKLCLPGAFRPGDHHN